VAKQTSLYQRHLEAGGKIVDFGGWDMPLHYGSQKQEHIDVRESAGVFDVSHMTVVDVTGDAANAWLRELLANDVDKLSEGQALYSCMLTEDGGVIDDLIAFRRGDNDFRLVVNAATRDKDMAWLEARADGHAVRLNERPDLSMIAVQGPQAREISASLLDDAEAALALRVFYGATIGDTFVSRTGYTGEDGFEILGSADIIDALWTELLDAGVKPAGLGARDTLRLEAAMNLYGNDMNEDVSPLECGLEWTVAFEPADRTFIGRAALEAQKQASHARFCGLLLEGKGVLRGGQRVETASGDGVITSGGFSPTMGRSIALARLPAGDETEASVDIRGKLQPVRIVKPPFVRRGKILV